MNDVRLESVPKPKYVIGQLVYLAFTMDVVVKAQCPDCGGKKVWPIKSPAGEDFELPCQRCAVGHYSHQAEALSLDSHQFGPAVRGLTIGSIRIDTASRDREHVSYMCEETGVGSGSIYYEDKLHPTREDADFAAKAAADARNLETPRVLLRAMEGKRLFNATATPAIVVAYARHRFSTLYNNQHALRLAEQLIEDAGNEDSDYVHRKLREARKEAESVDMVQAIEDVIGGAPIQRLADAYKNFIAPLPIITKMEEEA